MKKTLLCFLFIVQSGVLLTGQQLPSDDLGRVFNSPKLPEGSRKVKEAFFYVSDSKEPGGFRKEYAHFYDENRQKTKSIYYGEYKTKYQHVIEFKQKANTTYEHEYYVIPPDYKVTAADEVFSFEWQQREIYYSKDSLKTIRTITKYFDNSKIDTTRKIFNKNNHLIYEANEGINKTYSVIEYTYDANDILLSISLTEDDFKTIDFYNKNRKISGSLISRDKRFYEKTTYSYFWFPYTCYTKFTPNGDSVPYQQKLYDGNKLTEIKFFAWDSKPKNLIPDGCFRYRYPADSETPSDCYMIDKSDTLEWIHITGTGNTSTRYYIDLKKKENEIIEIKREDIITDGAFYARTKYVTKELATTDSIVFLLNHPELFSPETIEGFDSSSLAFIFKTIYSLDGKRKYTDTSYYDSSARLIRKTEQHFKLIQNKPDSLTLSHIIEIQYPDNGKSYFLKSTSNHPRLNTQNSSIYKGNQLLHRDTSSADYGDIINNSYDENDLITRHENISYDKRRQTETKHVEEFTYTPEHQVATHTKYLIDNNKKKFIEFLIENKYENKLPVITTITDGRGIQRIRYKVEYTYY
jgi:hypothetical protein